VGDDHRGQFLPFWQEVCDAGRPYACPYLADLQDVFCRQGSNWACNEAGILHVALSQSGEDLRRLDPAGATVLFQRGCDLGGAVACHNLERMANGASRLATARPTLDDYPVILRGSKGEITDREASALYALACREGWPDSCGGVGAR
jgi:hypothetical protein